MARRTLSVESLESRQLMAVDMFVPTDSFSSGEDTDPAAAHVDYYLKIDSIEGESSDAGAGGKDTLETYLTIELEDALISSYQMGTSDQPADDCFATIGITGGASSDRPMESFSMNYTKVEF